MSNIEKIREDLYVKKGWDGYRVVHPIKKDLNLPMTRDNINWKNFLFGGHWSYALKAVLFLIALYFFVQMYLHDTKVCREFVENIGLVCTQYNEAILDSEPNYTTFPQIGFNISLSQDGIKTKDS